MISEMEATMLTRTKIALAVLRGRQGIVFNCNLRGIEFAPGAKARVVGNRFGEPGAEIGAPAARR